MTKPMKILLVAAGILAGLFVLISLIAASGIWNFQNKEQANVENPEKEKPEEKNPAPANVSGNDDADLSDWKTYRNEEYGFEFKYSKDDCLLEGKAGIEYVVEIFPSCPVPADRGEVGSLNYSHGEMGTIRIVKSESDLGKYINEEMSDYNSHEEFDDFGLNGYNVIRDCSDWDGEGMPCITEELWIFKNNDYIFTLNESIQKNRIIKSILPTFKFIDSEDVSDWKTYRNEEYGFEFEYSKEWPKPILTEKSGKIMNGDVLDGKIFSWFLKIGELQKGVCEGSDCYAYEMFGLESQKYDDILSYLKEEKKNERVFDLTETAINGSKAITFTQLGISENDSALIFSEGKTILFIGSNGYGEEEFNNILNSLKIK